MLLNTDWVQACALLISQDAMQSIASEVSRKHGVALSHLRSECRERWICKARWEAYWRCRNELSKSPPEIGRFFNRDRNTVIYGIKRHLGASPKEALSGRAV